MVTGKCKLKLPRGPLKTQGWPKLQVPTPASVKTWSIWNPSMRRLWVCNCASVCSYGLSSDSVTLEVLVLDTRENEDYTHHGDESPDTHSEKWRYKSRQQDSIQIDKGKLNYGDRNQHNYCLRLHNDWETMAQQCSRVMKMSSALTGM